MMKRFEPASGATDLSLPDDFSAPAGAGDCLHPAIAEPLLEALIGRGITALTAVQTAVLEAGITGRDLKISSQTGSGKTIAIGLVLAPPLLEAAATSAPRALKTLKALVVVPTRELAVQVSAELEWLYAGVPGIEVECVTGGTSVSNERRRLVRKPAIVVGTPGRMLDHIRTNALDCTSIAEVVLDEADRMLDMGFREELEAILDATPKERLTHLVSATFPPEIQKLARKYQNDPVTVEGTRLGAANQDIEHIGHLVRLHDRYAAIVNLLLLGGDERTLVFVNTRAQAAELADQLAADGFSSASLSGELEQNQRTRTLEAFRTGLVGVLVATDVAARGLDVPDVTMVIHTDAPFDSESYTHRAGRTGRAGKKGRSVLLAPPQRQQKIEYLLSRAKVKLEWRDVPGAAQVEKALAKRERRRLRMALEEAPAPPASELVYAATLLEELDEGGAATLVARLIDLCRNRGIAEPRQVEPVRPGSAGRSRVGDLNDRAPWQRPAPRARTNESRSAERTRPADLSEARERSRRTDDDRPMHRESEGPRGRDRRAEQFEINLGHKGGATPQRLLAMLCRRGDVSGRMIGSIEIDSHMASFEVCGDVAREFEHNASMPDSRDPHVLIRRARPSRR
ncbi:MAG TPA: DEAD/DEAH box helicase [Candidatus Limnocylindrales bacterium]|nr:DEAD/DEAH box helicase [Candidatus Limnocylindrales bacterium]